MLAFLYDKYIMQRKKKNQEKLIFLTLPVEFEHKVIRNPSGTSYDISNLST